MSAAGQAKIRRGSRCSDVKVFVEQVWLLICKLDHANEQHRFELEPFDVLDIKRPHVVLLASNLAVRARGAADVACRQHGVELRGYGFKGKVGLIRGQFAPSRRGTA